VTQRRQEAAWKNLKSTSWSFLSSDRDAKYYTPIILLGIFLKKNHASWYFFFFFL
jgi:hypothetical protein